MAKRIDYQNPDGNLDEIADKRNNEIRAWGRQQLIDADNAIFRNDDGSVDEEASGWSSVNVEPDLKEVVEITEPEPELTLSEPLDVIEISVEPTQPEAPKAPKTPKTPKATTS